MNDPQQTAFGQRLRAHRHAAGLTQDQTAETARISPVTLRSWESGATRPRPLRLADLARALDVPMGAFFCPDDHIVLTEVLLGPAALERLARDGEKAVDELAAELAHRLKPLLRTAKPLREAVAGTRAKPRRTREEILAEQTARLDELKRRSQSGRRKLT